MSNELVPYSDIEKMGKAVAESSLFGIKTQQQAVALMLVAQALGKHPALAAMEYNIIQGRPAKKADAMLIDFQGAGGKIEWHELTDTKADATFSHPQGGSLRLTWDIDRAKKAGLYEKDGSMYKKYPRQMLRARLVADGVRAVYPAATGGMLSKEEAEDITDIQIDNTKSRVEQIIDTHCEEVKDVKKEEAPKETKKTTKDKSKAIPVVNEPTAETLPEGHKIAQGIITQPAKYSEIGEAKTPKWLFIMGDLKLGTFDKKVFEDISAVLDLQKDTPILLKIEYKERQSGDKILKDIVKFSQVTADKVVPI